MSAENINQNTQRAKNESFLLAGGKLGELIRQYNWEETPMGVPDAWPESLKTTVRIMLTSQQPIWIGWGADLIKLYNDPYREILGEKHPVALGVPVSQVWSEIWDAVGPRLTKVVEKNEGTFDEALLLIIDRYGYKEETYFTFSYSPIPDEMGGVGGVFCATTEETKNVIYERELTLLNDLTNQISPASSSEEIFKLSAQSFGSNKKDIPFALFYKVDKEKNTLRLDGSTGVEPGNKFAPDEVEIDDNSFLPFDKALEVEDYFSVDIETWIGELPTGDWQRPPRQIVLVPLQENKVVVGVLVLGLNPYRPFDDVYKAFVLNIKKQISDNLTYLDAAQQKRRYITEVFKQAPAAIAVIEGEDLVYTLANPLYQQLLGRTEEQLLGNTVSQVFPEFEGQGIIAILKDVLRTGKTFEALEYKLLLDREANGNPEVFYFNYVIQTIPDKMGHKNAVMVHAADVTDQILAKQKLKESEEKYRNLFTKMDQGFCIIELIFDEDTKPIDYLFVEVNPTFEKQTGLNNAAGKTAKELIPDLESHWFDIYGKVALTGVPYRFVEWSEVMKRWFEVYAFRLGGKESKKVALLFSDITQQKEDAQAMEKSEAHYRFVSNTTPVMIWLTDENNECIFLNQTWENVTGQSFEEGKGFGWLDHTHPDDFDRVQKEFVEASKRQIAFNIDYRLRRKDGQYTWVFDSGAPLINEEGKFLGYTGSVIDINDRKIAEQKMRSLTEQLALSNEELAAANEEINAGIEELSAKNTALSAINTDMDNFIYTASHDLKAPIANIEGLVKSLERNIGTNLDRQEMVEKLISMIYQSVDRFKKTIVDLTEITKIQKENLEDQSEVDLIEIIDDLKRDFHYQMEEDDVQLIVDIDENFSTIMFSRKKLKSIVYNLLSNAIKYRAPERRPLIRISSEKIPGYTLLSVRDNGLGFGEKAGANIFSMFKRLHTHVEGSGIGLYIVKKIIDDAGGKIEVESKVNEGTTFKVFFKDGKGALDKVSG